MARSLVERLRDEELRLRKLAPYSEYDEGRADATSDAIDLAAPYEARRLALEKVAEAATAILKSQDDHAMTLDVRLVIALRTFLAAVPEIPEES